MFDIQPYCRSRLSPRALQRLLAPGLAALLASLAAEWSWGAMLCAQPRGSGWAAGHGATRGLVHAGHCRQHGALLPALQGGDEAPAVSADGGAAQQAHREQHPLPCSSQGCPVPGGASPIAGHWGCSDVLSPLSPLSRCHCCVCALLCPPRGSQPSLFSTARIPPVFVCIWGCASRVQQRQDVPSCFSVLQLPLRLHAMNSHQIFRLYFSLFFDPL